MQKPGAPPQGNARSFKSAEGAKYSWLRIGSVAIHNIQEVSRISRLQRFVFRVGPPRAMPQAVTFRALGA